MSDAELARVDQINNKQCLVVEAALRKLNNMANYKAETHKRILAQLYDHTETLAVEIRCLRQYIAEEQESRNKMEKALEHYRKWFVEISEGYFQLIKDRVRGGEGNRYGNSQAVRSQNKRIHTSWKLFLTSMEDAFDMEGEFVCNLLPERKELCETSQ